MRENSSARGSAEPTVADIDQGLPTASEAWPLGVLDRLMTFSQGDIIEAPPMFYFADPQSPVWRETFNYIEGSAGPEIVSFGQKASPTFGILTSQTCDIAEEGKTKPIYPWVQVSPVYDRSDLNSGLRRLLTSGKGPKYLLHLPALPGGFWVADFRIEVPVEKGWLAAQARIDGFEDEERKCVVGSRLAWTRNRPAFGGAFVTGVQQPLVEKLRTLQRDDEATFIRMSEQVAEVALRFDSRLDPKFVQVVCICSAELEEDLRKWWFDWWDQAAQGADNVGIVLLPLDIKHENNISLAEYRRMTVLPLERVSPD